MKKLIFLLLVSLAACNPRPEQAISSSVDEMKLARRPKNVILLIGDGMGLTQISAGLYSNHNKLNLEQFHYIGLHKSYSADNLITDSAAGADAFSCGVKTYNSAVGVDKDTMPVRTILEEAEELGMPTGLVVTCSVTHATPAAFVAHVKSRKLMEEIAADFLKTDVDLIIGGGKKYFDSREKDNRNLYQELQAKGYNISDFTKQELSKVKVDYSKNFAYFTAEGEPVSFAKGRDYLVPASKLAIDFLHKRSDKGFFLMIEGSQIDWGGHSNNSPYIISEMLDFDKAIGAALDFAKADGETLVIITADHETGGYAIINGSKMDSIVGAFTTEHHTAALIPVFAYGPGAELFTGIFENTAIHDKMRYALGFKGAPKAMQPTNSR